MSRITNSNNKREIEVLKQEQLNTVKAAILLVNNKERLMAIEDPCSDEFIKEAGAIVTEYCGKDNSQDTGCIIASMITIAVACREAAKL